MLFRSGFVIPVKGYEELSSRVIQLFTDDELRERLGNVGRNMVEKSYTRNSVAQATLNLYYKYIGSSKTRRINQEALL